jgi:hypothetical protein
MNARQKAKKYKKKISTLESDNDLMRRIIADTPSMQELYDAYNKPKFVTHTTMQFQEFRARRIVPAYMMDIHGVIERAKQAVAEDLFEGIKENITYNVDTECMTPTITASIFIGISEE